MKTVSIKFEKTKKYKNAFYFLSIERVIVESLGVNDYFNVRIVNGYVEVTSDNEELIDGLKMLWDEVKDEND